MLAGQGFGLFLGLGLGGFAEVFGVLWNLLIHNKHYLQNVYFRVGLFLVFDDPLAKIRDRFWVGSGLVFDRN